jgi:hypothetical protein
VGSSTIVELFILFVLWISFLVGAADALHNYRDATCFHLNVCDQSRTFRAMAWITFGLLSGLASVVLSAAVNAKVASKGGVLRNEFSANPAVLPGGTCAGDKGWRPEVVVALA